MSKESFVLENKSILGEVQQAQAVCLQRSRRANRKRREVEGSVTEDAKQLLQATPPPPPLASKEEAES
eukprot:scaffold2031_cov179-Ochromonas_danica.AAC.1